MFARDRRRRRWGGRGKERGSGEVVSRVERSLRGGKGATGEFADGRAGVAGRQKCRPSLWTPARARSSNGGQSGIDFASLHLSGSLGFALSRTAFEPGFRKSIDPGPASPCPIDGGQSGIRTHGRLPYTRFPSVLLKPLRHLSIVKILRVAKMMASGAFARKKSSFKKITAEWD